MRAVKSERKIKKIKNNTDEFYLSWIKNSDLAKVVEGAKLKDIGVISDRLKKSVNEMYISLDCDRKYKFYGNLYMINSLFCLYFGIRNEFISKLRMKEEELVLPIENVPAFSNEIVSKAEKAAKYAFSSFQEVMKIINVPIRKEDTVTLQKVLEKEVEKEEIPLRIKEDSIQEEIKVINEIIMRINWARKNTDTIFLTKSKEEEAKKAKRNVRSSLSRTENVMKIILSEVMNAYDDEVA